MIQVKLRLNDGLGQGRVWLRSVVKKLQRALAHAGHDLVVDGRFGGATLAAARAFQVAKGLLSSGEIDGRTWTALTPHLAATQPSPEISLEGFRGDLEWIQELEGFSGKPYWPGGVSGVTLDPGVDLGHVGSWELVEQLYRDAVTSAQLQSMREVFGFKGQDARAALSASPTLLSIRIDDEHASALMPRASEPYWKGITARFEPLRALETPASVQTSLLSLAYNRGSQNRHLEGLGKLLRAGKWAAVADKIAGMQQGHKLLGVRRRRRYEGLLIRAELDFLAD